MNAKAATTDKPTGNGRATIPLPQIAAVALADVPASKGGAQALSNEESAYASSIYDILQGGSAARGGGFADKPTAENSGRRVRRMVAKVGNLAYNTLRATIASEADGFAWYIRIGEPSKGGRKAES